MQRYKSSVIKKENITQDIILLELSSPREFTFEAGQYIQIKAVKENEEKWKSFSIANPPSQKGKIMLIIKLIEGGFASEFIKDLKEGDEIDVKGPLGIFGLRQDDKDVVMVGAGTGIAPIYSMILENIGKKENKGKKFTLIFGAKTGEELVFSNVFKELERKHDDFEFISVLSRQEWKNKGHVQEYLPENVTNTTFYICGLKEMVTETKETLLKKGVKEEDIKTERYN